MRTSENTLLGALFVLAVACPMLLLSMARPLAPTGLPALQLTAAEVTAVMQADADAARRAPSTPAALELDRLFLEHGEAEARALEAGDQRDKRLAALRGTYLRVLQESGEPAALALRARAVDRLEAALDLRLPEEQLRGVMGVFPNVLEVHGVTTGGDEIAPHFVIRALYKARWNMAVQQPPDFALARVEQQAFHGWLALHAENLALPVRLDELAEYAKAGGAHASEAHAVLLYLHQERVAAAEQLDKVASASGNLRLRNYLVGARVAANLVPR